MAECQQLNFSTRCVEKLQPNILFSLVTSEENTQKCSGAPNCIQYWWCIYSIEFQKMVVHNTSFKVNFQNIGGWCAPDAHSMLGSPGNLRFFALVSLTENHRNSIFKFSNVENDYFYRLQFVHRIHEKAHTNSLRKWN